MEKVGNTMILNKEYNQITNLIEIFNKMCYNINFDFIYIFTRMGENGELLDETDQNVVYEAFTKIGHCSAYDKVVHDMMLKWSRIYLRFLLRIFQENHRLRKFMAEGINPANWDMVNDILGVPKGTTWSCSTITH